MLIRRFAVFSFRFILPSQRHNLNLLGYVTFSLSVSLFFTICGKLASGKFLLRVCTSIFVLTTYLECHLCCQPQLRLNLEVQLSFFINLHIISSTAIIRVSSRFALLSSFLSAAVVVISSYFLPRSISILDDSVKLDSHGQAQPSGRAWRPNSLCGTQNVLPGFEPHCHFLGTPMTFSLVNLSKLFLTLLSMLGLSQVYDPGWFEWSSNVHPKWQGRYLTSHFPQLVTRGAVKVIAIRSGR
jgi:hypothetical protein